MVLTVQVQEAKHFDIIFDAKTKIGNDFIYTPSPRTEANTFKGVLKIPC